MCEIVFWDEIFYNNESNYNTAMVALFNEKCFKTRLKPIGYLKNTWKWDINILLLSVENVMQSLQLQLCKILFKSAI